MNWRQALALLGLSALGYRLWKSRTPQPLASRPLTLSDGSPLPNVGLFGTLFARPLTLSGRGGAALPQIGLPGVPVTTGVAPYRDATDPNYTQIASTAQGSATYAGYNAPGSSTWGVPTDPAVQTPSVNPYGVLAPDLAPANGDQLDQARETLADRDDSPSVNSESAYYTEQPPVENAAAVDVAAATIYTADLL